MKAGVNSRVQRFFSQREIEIMMENNVPYEVAYQRVNTLKMDRDVAIRKPLAYGKGRRKKVEI